MREAAKRILIVGAGVIARGRHLPAAELLAERVQIVGFVDLDRGRAQELQREWGSGGVFDDLSVALDETSPDLAVICTPPVAHRDAVIACLDRGVDVWCEKPAALSLAEFDEMSAHEGPEGPYVSFVVQHRFGSAAQRLAHLIESGELGAPLVALCNTLWFRDHDYFAVPWRGKFATEGGGPTVGHGIHQIDLMLSLVGEWTEVRAMMGTIDRDTEAEDVSMIAVRLASGGMLSIVNSVISPREESYLRFDFRDATVELSHTYGYDNDNWRWTPAPHVADTARIAAWPPAENVRSSHGAQLAHVLDSLRDGVRPRSSGSDARSTLEFLTACYQSADSGVPVTPADVAAPGNPYYRGLGAGRLVEAAS